MNSDVLAMNSRAFANYFNNIACPQFAMLESAGARNLAHYGGALCDAAHGLKPKDYGYSGTLPYTNARSLDERIGYVVTRFSRVIPGEYVSVMVSEAHGSARFRFNYLGRALDVGLMVGDAPAAYDLADYGSIGLRSIAMTQQGMVFASRRYVDDAANQTITVRPDLSQHEFDRGVERAYALQSRYKGHKIVVPPERAEKQRQPVTAFADY